MLYVVWVVACVVAKILYHQSHKSRLFLLLLTFGFEFGENGL
jgi:hypothetical protein